MRSEPEDTVNTGCSHRASQVVSALMDSWLMTIRLLSLPTRRTLANALDPNPDSQRLLAVVELQDSEGLSGWGECAALNRVGYSSESAGTAFTLLSESEVLDKPGAAAELVSEHPMAMAALEMAEFDLRLKGLGISLAAYMGITAGSVPAGAVLAMGSPAQVQEAARALADQGYGRIKLKIAPARLLGFPPAELFSAVRDAAPGVELTVDANGSFGADDRHDLDALITAGMDLIEQPFAPADVALAAEMVASEVVVMADEAATSAEQISRLVDMSACTGVVVKSPRLGGLFAAFETLGWCEENGVPASAGGMLESGLGRHALAVTAANPACTITGDISPARSWLAHDPWPDVQMVDGRVAVPTGPGVAPDPDLELLERFTVSKSERRVGGQ